MANGNLVSRGGIARMFEHPESVRDDDDGKIYDFYELSLFKFEFVPGHCQLVLCVLASTLPIAVRDPQDATQ